MIPLGPACYEAQKLRTSESARARVAARQIQTAYELLDQATDALEQEMGERRMANYYAHARSNYFLVTDPDAFDAFCAKWGLHRIATTDEEGRRLVGFYVETPNDDGFPSEPCWEWLEQHDTAQADYAGPSLQRDLSALLADGWVAVGVEVGAEKLRYLTGVAWAVNRKGEEVDVDLDEEIRKAAAALGTHVTPCAY